MIIPGANVLALAQSVIGKQSFQYKPYAARTNGPNGLLATSYGALVPAKGSVQPVPRSLYQNLGLNFQQSYFYFYVSRSVVDVSRDVSGDQFIWNGGTYQALSKTPWSSIDGWDAVLTIKVP